jgi:acyl-CoA dehydrogenase
MGTAQLFAPCFEDVKICGDRILPVNFSAFAVLVDELARTRCFSLTLVTCLHVGVFLPFVLRLANESLRDRVVASALDGSVIGTIAATESPHGGGSYFLSKETRVDLREDVIIPDGHKDYVTNLDADYVVVFARWQQGRHFTNFCSLLVPTRLTGVRRSRIPMAVMGAAGVGRIGFEGVQLPRAHLLGRKALGFQYFTQHIAVERVVGGIWSIAVAEDCLVSARKHAQTRIIGTETL